MSHPAQPLFTLLESIDENAPDDLIKFAKENRVFQLYIQENLLKSHINRLRVKQGKEAKETMGIGADDVMSFRIGLISDYLSKIDKNKADELCKKMIGVGENFFQLLDKQPEKNKDGVILWGEEHNFLASVEEAFSIAASFSDFKIPEDDQDLGDVVVETLAIVSSVGNPLEESELNDAPQGDAVIAEPQKRLYPLKEADMVDIGEIDLRSLSRDDLLQKLKSLYENKAEKIALKFPDDFSENQLQEMLSVLDKNPYLNNIVLIGNLFESQAKSILDIQNRNKLIAYYEMEKEDMDNPWKLLVETHFKDYNPSGRYDIIKDYRNKDFVTAATELGATWHKHFFEYLSENKAQWEMTGFPYNRFSPGLNSYAHYDLLSQVVMFNEYASRPDAYLPFSEILIQSTSFDTSAEGLNKLHDEIVSFFLQAARHNIKMIGIGNMGRDQKEFEDSIHLLLVKLLEAAKEGKIITQLNFGLMKSLKDEDNIIFLQLKNQIQNNIRAKNQQLRAGHFEQDRQPHIEKKQPQKELKKEDIRACKRNAASALENVGVEIQMQQQQQQQQQQQEQQQVQMQAQRDQMLEDLMKRKAKGGNIPAVDSKGFLDFKKFSELYEKNPKYTRNAYASNKAYSQISRVWSNIVGDGGYIKGMRAISGEEGFPPIISGISKSVADLIVTYPQLFAQGLNLNDLPPGFILKQDKDNEKNYLLDYDSAVAKLLSANPDRQSGMHTKILPLLSTDKPDWSGDEKQYSAWADNPLTSADFSELAGLGDKKIFQKGTEEEKLSLILKLIKNENLDLGIKIEADYKALLSLFKKNYSLISLSNIVYVEGAQGVKILLDKLDDMRLKLGDEATANFIENFIGKNPKESINLIENTGLDGIDKLKNLSAGEYAWWISLNDQESAYNSDIHFLDQLDAFLEFKEKLKGIDPNIKMESPCPLDDVKNMKVALSRVLAIVSNALDPQEQFYHLNGLKLGNYDAYQASQAAGYYFVSKEMVLDVKRLDLTISHDDKSRNLYEIKLEDFSIINEASAKLEDYKVHYFRLLGQQIYLDNYQKYLELIEKLDFFSKQYTSSIGPKEAAILGLDASEMGKPDSIPKVALGLIALATTHKNAMGSIKPEMVDQMFKAFEKIEGLDLKGLRKIEAALLSYCSPNNTQIAAPIGQQLPALIQFHADLGSKHEWNKNPANIKLISESFFKIIDTRYRTAEKFNGTESEPLSAKDLVKTIEAITQSEVLNRDGNKALKDSVFKLFSTMSRDAFSEENLNTLISNIEDKAQNPEEMKKIQIMMDILTGIDPTHAKTSALPNISEYTTVVTAILEDKAFTSYSDIFKAITKSPGFENCHFSNTNIPAFDPDAAKKMISENKAEIKEALEDLGMKLEDSDFDDPVALLNKIKAVADRIPFLSVVLGKFKNSIITEHYAAVNEYAKSKLARVDELDQTIKALSSIFENQLYTKDVEKSSNVEELLATLQGIESRTKNINALTDVLAKIKSKSSADYTKIVDALQSGHGISEIPITHLTAIIDKLSRAHRKEFPHEILESVTNNSSVKQGLIQDWDDVVEQKLNDLLRNTDLPFSQISKAVNLILNLIGQKAHKNEIDKFNKILSESPNIRTGLIDCVDKILSDKNFERFELIRDKRLISSIHGVLEILGHQSNADQLKNIFSNQLTSSSSVLLTALPILNDISGEHKNDIVSNLVMILSRLQSEDNNENDVAKLLDSLKNQDISFLSQLSKFDEDLGFPSCSIILETIEDGKSIDDLISSRIKEVSEKRDMLLSEQFSDLEVHRVLEGMVDLTRNDRILYEQRKQLQEQFYFINAIGHTHSTKTELNNPDSPNKIVKDMSKQELLSLLRQHKIRFQNPSTSDKEKKESQLIYLALLRESMYRTTGRVPYSTQILSVLNAINKGSNNISEIQTGQGKSLMSALYASMLELEGQAVDVCTSNLQLAKESLDENEKFYHYIGVKVGVIDSTSPLDAYNQTGINYSDVAQLALFRAKMQIEGGKEPEKASLVLDEADYTLLDDTTQYRYAVSLDDVGDPSFNPYGWVYELVNQFIETSAFNDETASIKDDINNLRAYLIEHATGAQKNLAKDPNQITDKQLDIWIDSSVAARELYKQRDKKWTLTEEEEFGKKISVARLIVNDRVSPDAQWSNGVQQMIHARINSLDPDIKDGKKPKCNIDPEKQAVASTTSKNFIDYYNQKGGHIYGMTGTIGSSEEITEHRQKFGFSLTSIPAHQGQKRVDRKPIMVDTDAEHQEKIFAEILKKIRVNDKMPILIICKDAPTSKALSEYIEAELSKQQKHYPLTLQLFNGVDKKKVDYTASGSNTSALGDESKIRDLAGKQGTITISTPMMGRGTDFKPEKLKKGKRKDGEDESWIKHPDGLFVMQTYVDSDRTSRQIVGRSGRQGWFGESMTIVSKEALVRDFELVGQKNKTIQDVDKGIDEIRSVKNLSSKERRLLSESYGDVRNDFFAKIIQLLDRVPAYNEEQDFAYQQELGKDEKDRDLEQFDMRSPADIRKSVLKQWEVFLNDLDLEWKKILSEQDKPDLEHSLDLLSKNALSKWDKMIQPYQAIALKDGLEVFKLKISSDEMAEMIKEIIASRNKEMKLTLPDSHKALPREVNIHKVVCDTSTKPSVDILKFAYEKELDLCLDKLKFIEKHNKNVKITFPENWALLAPTQQFKFLHEATQQILSNPDKVKGLQSLIEVRALERDIKSISSWVSDFSELKELSRELKAAQFESDMNKRALLSKQSPEKLIEHDRDMLAREQQGLYPARAFSTYLNTRDVTLVERLKQDILADVSDYKQMHFISRAKRTEAAKLYDSMEKAKSFNDLLKFLVNARESVAITEKKTDVSGRFFSQTDKILERLIANATDKNIETVKAGAIGDVFAVLSTIERQTKDPNIIQLMTVIRNNADSKTDLSKLNYFLARLRDSLGNDPKLAKVINGKINQVIHLQEKEKMISSSTITPVVAKQESVIPVLSVPVEPMREEPKLVEPVQKQSAWKTATVSVSPEHTSSLSYKPLVLSNHHKVKVKELSTQDPTLSVALEPVQTVYQRCAEQFQQALKELESGRLPNFCQADVPLRVARQACIDIIEKISALEKAGKVEPKAIRMVAFDVGAGRVLRKENPLSELRTKLEGMENTSKSKFKPGGNPASGA